MSIKLGNICSFQSGGTPAKGKPEYFNGTIPWITTTALNGSNINENDAIDWITERAIEETAAKIVPAYSIMVGTRVGVGKVAVNTVDMSTSQDIISLLNINERVWSKEFLCKYLQAKSSYLNSQARGATIKGIKIDVLAGLEVPTLEYSQQQHISNTLDKVLSIIKSRQRELQKLDCLVKARFVEMFGNPIINEKGFEAKSGNEVFKLSNGKFIPESKRLDSGIPVYGGNGISWYTDEILSEDNTVVVGRVGFQSGNVHLAKGPLWVSDNAMYISALFDSGYDMRFLYSVMEHIDFTRFQDAGDLKKITQKPFMQMKYIKPPISMQREYNSFVAQVDKSKVAVQAALDEAQLLFDSLMQQYFG